MAFSWLKNGDIHPLQWLLHLDKSFFGYSKYQHACISIVPTPGHSLGHQSVIIQRGQTSVVHCGDVSPLREDLKRRNIPGVLDRADQALKSIDKLRAIKNQSYIFSHDNEQQRLK